MAWTAAVNAGISRSDVRDMMLEAVKARLRVCRAPHPVQAGAHLITPGLAELSRGRLDLTIAGKQLLGAIRGA